MGGRVADAGRRGVPVAVGLLDDHELFRRGARHAIEAIDQPRCTVTVDADSPEAFDRVATRVGLPDVVVCDLYLTRSPRPHLEVIGALVKRGAAVVVVSAAAEPANVYRAVTDRGAASYVVKDMGADTLVEVVRAVAAGRPVMPPELASALLDYAPLTRRQHEVLTLIAEGLTYREIAAALHVTVHTVETHVSNLCDRLGLRRRRELTTATYARQLFAPADPEG